MKRFTMFLFCLLCFGCEDKHPKEEDIVKVINSIIENRNYLKGLRVNILRFPSSTIEYEIRSENSRDFGVIQTYPDKKVLKEREDNSTDLKILDLLSEVNEKNNKVASLLDFQNDVTQIEYNTVGYRIRIREITSKGNQESSKCQIVTSVSGEWCYTTIKMKGNRR